jgi:hypothetical protein
MSPVCSISKIFCKITVCLISIFVIVNAQEIEKDIQEELRILSAYHGLDPVPALATRLCGMAAVADQDGMPVVFSVQIDGATLSPDAFAVETSAGEIVAPVCATLRPALEPLEQRTVLLIGPFSPEGSVPISVEIVTGLEDVDGQSLRGLRIDLITPLSAGPSIVLAERYAPDAEGLREECPGETAQAVQLTWQGGVTGPQGADLAEAQRGAVSVLLEDGVSVNPLLLGDDDPDNIVIACIAQSSPAISVSVSAGFFYDPGDDANPETEISVSSKW